MVLLKLWLLIISLRYKVVLGIIVVDGGGGKLFFFIVSGINVGDIIDVYINVKNGDSLNLIIILNFNVLVVIFIY